MFGSLSAVPSNRRQASQSGNAPPIDLAQLWQFGNQSRRDNRTDARGGLQALTDCGQLIVGGDDTRHLKLDTPDMTIESSDNGGDTPPCYGVCSLLQPCGLLLAHLDKLPTTRCLRLQRPTHR